MATLEKDAHNPVVTLDGPGRMWEAPGWDEIRDFAMRREEKEAVAKKTGGVFQRIKRLLGWE